MEAEAEPSLIEPSGVGDDALKAAWEDVVLKGLPPKVFVRPEILRSWLRCRERGLDPFTKSPPPVLRGNKLRGLLKQNKLLIDISRSVIEMIEISLRDTGFIVTLTDRNGYVLDVQGNQEIMQMAKENFYIPGCLRTNENAGTNAIGLCLLQGKPIQLTGAEHYKLHHHPWTCSSAPIKDTGGEILGAITLSGKSIGRHKHTLALITTAAETIESQLRERDLIQETQRLSSELSLIFHSISDGLIAVDNSQCITRLNSNAAEMLGLNQKTMIGRPLSKMVQPEEALILALKRKKYFRGTETTFSCPKGQQSYICSVAPVKNSGGRTLGAIITLAKKRQVLDIAKKIGGNYAKYQFDDIKGHDFKLLRQIELAKIAARTNSRILIIGESGTGKELFAQAVHSYSNRRNEPFVAVSCAAIPRDLIESELFGYRGGAFTGARRHGQMGKFELANKGTLFLDEVNGLPLDLQAKLLRVLQQNEIMRLGDTRPIPIDVRVIAASNVDLMTEVENANFREDLYYRLNVVEIYIPPLRDRVGDIQVLIDHILKRHCQEMNIKRPKIAHDVMKIFKAYAWPGNVRELENCIERALLLSRGALIQRHHLPKRIHERPSGPGHKAISVNQGYKEMIEKAIERNRGNLSKVAGELKIARSTLYRKMKEFGLFPVGTNKA
ncbi:MAG: sigma 54-interacting transcriptional regulator [Deltaproteobacteria bacterium]